MAVQVMLCTIYEKVPFASADIQPAQHYSPESECRQTGSKVLMDSLTKGVKA